MMESLENESEDCDLRILPLPRSLSGLSGIYGKVTQNLKRLSSWPFRHTGMWLRPCRVRFIGQAEQAQTQAPPVGDKASQNL